MVLKTTEAEGTPSMCVAEGVNASFLRLLGWTQGYVTCSKPQGWNRFHYCLSLSDDSQHLANIGSWRLCSGVWLSFHRFTSLPPSLNVKVPGTSVWNNSEADASTPDISVRSWGINTVAEATGRTMIENKMEASSKLPDLLCSPLCSALQLAMTSSSWLSMNILIPWLLKKTL